MSSTSIGQLEVVRGVSIAPTQFIEWSMLLRGMTHIFVFGYALVVSLAQETFVNIDFLIPVGVLASLGLFFQTLKYFLPESISEHYLFDKYIFYLDTILICGYLFLSSFKLPFFILFLLLHLFLMGMRHGGAAAISVSLWVIIWFMASLVASTELASQELYQAFFFNSIAFAGVSLLSGQLKDQIFFLGQNIDVVTKSLEKLENINDLIVANMGSGLFVLDAKFNILVVNPQAQSLLPKKETVLNDFAIKKISSMSESKIRFEQTFEVDGEDFEIEFVASRLNVKQEDSGYILLAQDLTIQKNLERKVRQQEKLAAVGQLAAGIAHEIRNPLASMSGSIQLLASDSDITSAEDKKLFAIVLREIDRLNDLITEFLDYVRPEEKGKESFSLSDLTLGVLEMVKLNDRLPKSVVQRNEIQEGCEILGKKDKLKQALLNIVINSYQAMDKAEVSILTSRVYRKEGFVVLEFTDTGCGMDAKGIQKMFEPFHTTKAKGTGLGLAVTYKILESHDAEIKVKSEVGVGTTFSLSFPSSSDSMPSEIILQKQA